MNMNEHFKILNLAANKKLPEKIDETSEFPIDILSELIDAGYIKAIDASTIDSNAVYLEAKITFHGRQYLNELESQLKERIKMQDSNIRLFISHSSRDVPFVQALIDLIRASLNLDVSKIRCTSIDGYRLPGGANTNEQLKREVHEAEAFIGVISNESIKSIYVVFELGARWGANRSLIPLIAPGANNGVLGGPLSGINALDSSNRSQLSQLLDDLSRELSLPLQPASSFQRHMDAIVNLLPQTTSGIKEAENILKQNNYELVETEGSAIVYKSKTEPTHFACPSCFKNEIHILQDRRVMTGVFDCPNCKTVYPVKPVKQVNRRVISKGIEI
jgi:predicted RNA-binding Zn-ribbon protein involved in translation (DUF1610 family)